MKNNNTMLNRRSRRNGFSLIELLVVVAIIALVASISVVVLKKPQQDISVAASGLSDILQQARTRAMTTNNYVYVSLTELSSTSPQLAVAVFESTDGVASSTNALDPSTLQPVRKLEILEGIRLDTAAADGHLSGNPLTTAAVGVLSDVQADSLISAPATVVTRRNDVPGGQLVWVIQFSPDGAARLDAEARTVPDYIVMGIVPAVGDTSNAVGIMINGPSGAVQVLRPGI